MNSRLFYDQNQHVKSARMRLYAAHVRHLCRRTEPKSGVARELWEEFPRTLAALRRYKQLGEVPRKEFAWIRKLLENDVAGAMEKRYASQPHQEVSLALLYIQRNFSDVLTWTSPAKVRRHVKDGGTFGHRMHPGLSSPACELDDMAQHYSYRS